MIVLDHFELSTLGNRALMDVAAQHELHSGGREPLQAPGRACARDACVRRARAVRRDGGGAPRPQRARRRSVELRREAVELGPIDCASLLTPRANRVHSDDREPIGRVDGLCRSEDTFPRLASPREACREDIRNVVVSRNREQRETEAFEQLTRPLELGRATAMCEVTRDHEDLGIQPGNQLA